MVRRYEQTKRPWVVGGIRWINDRGESLGDIAAPPSWMTASMHASLGWNCIHHMATYVSRDLFTELGGFDVAYKDSGDYEFFSRALARYPYLRIERTLACFRRTGNNNSMINRERANKESHAVMETFAPRSALQRSLSRHFMKVWLNGTNPAWAARKWSGATRSHSAAATS